MPVTIGDSVLLTSKAIRDKLENWHQVTARNTPSLEAITDDLLRKKRTFADLETVKREVKFRSFGIRHADAMNVMRQRQDDAMNLYMQNRHIPNRPAMGAILNSLRRASSSRSVLTRLNTLYGAIPFFYWGSPTYLDSVTSSVTYSSNLYKWLSGVNNNPGRQLNCWECVLYSGAWTDRAARRQLYSTEYAFWALQSALIRTCTFDPNSAAVKTPRFVRHIVENPVYHLTSQQATAVGDGPAVPEVLWPGMIVVLNCGQHVAMATGAMRRPTTDEAVDAYGPRGHEIIELDGATVGMEVNTVEDRICDGYNNEIHVGWLPESGATAINLSYGATNIGTLAPTRFYA